VILFHDPVNFDQVDGIAWDGSTQGRIGANPSSGNGIWPNPDGSLYGTARDIRNRSGAIVTSLPGDTKGFAGTWADDGRHYCSMVSASPVGQIQGEPATLQIAEVGKAPRSVLQVGRAYEQTSIGVAACSITADLAVVVQSGGQGMGTAQFWVVQLSTGHVMWTRSYGTAGQGAGIDIRASRDARLIAEIASGCCATSTASTTIYDPTGTLLGHVTGRVEAFSWDGSLAVQMPFYGGSVSVIRWRDATRVWLGPSGAGFYAALPEPDGQRIAVSLRDPNHAQTGGFPPVDIFVVQPGGQAHEILEDVLQ
jgi:hypothetical protein